VLENVSGHVVPKLKKDVLIVAGDFDDNNRKKAGMASLRFLSGITKRAVSD